MVNVQEATCYQELKKWAEDIPLVELLQQAQAQKTNNAEIGTACFPVEQGVSIFMLEEDGKDFDFEKVRPG